MSCTDRWAHGALDRLFVGELQGADFDRLHQHAAGCNSCSLQYDRITHAEQRLTSAEGLSAQRLSLLQGRVAARAEAANEKDRTAERANRWWMPALGLGLAAAVAVAVAYVPAQRPSEYQARGAGTHAAFGIRAFCISGTQVVAEALPGGRLKCAAGSAVQLTYTAPADATLNIHVNGTVPMFPAEGGAAKIGSGVDVPLDFSTPVTDQWLSQPAQLTATFEAEGGKTARSVITVEQ